MRIERTLLGACCALLLAGTAGASPFNPLVDFRTGGPFRPSGSTAVHAASWGGYGMVIEAMAPDGHGDLTRDGRLYWDGEDGFGIRGASYEDDEIENPEVLRISFDRPIFVERFLLSDLYYMEGPPGRQFVEQGSYSTNGGSSWTPFFADSHTSNGEKELDLAERLDEILFTAPGRTIGGNHEFSVAGFDAYRIGQASAPEPGGVLLFGAGLALLAARVRVGLTRRAAA